MAATPEDSEKDSEATTCPAEEGMQATDTPPEAALPRTQECATGGEVNASAMGGSGGSEREKCDTPGLKETTGEETAGDALPPPQSSLPETEVRRRRLQHFVSMGGAATNLDTSSPVADEADQKRLADASPASDKVQGVDDEKRKEEEVEEEKEQGKEEPRPPGSIKIRLKFLDETQRHVFAQLTEKVGSFKRQHFSIELDDNRRIRLIFNGQLLSRDSSTLAQYGLFDNCVVHCHVSQPQLLPRTPGRSGEAAAQEEEDAYVSRLLAPLLYAVMVVMWYLRYEYGHLFNTMSTIILLFLTALLLISTYLLYITQHVPQTATAAAATPVSVTTSFSTSSSTSSSASASPPSAAAST
ncbi:transmembrane and ubiquitin-like domain-containing protein 1 [Eriocheir sinensis]|uniref:transmembrane and ubiquitin-like domain-containing protein 1 n=1 Tax=Eriocheir sinensis TaxID=95602 RepID=UPI0021C63B28|nr:transmembrane and ubiquitin-like domain-containing protein 1 [Eriocheir sinensis]